MQGETYFLGGNTSQGFVSCYDGFCRPQDGSFLWIIKSGPGSGKSTLMRRVADEARKRGFATETVLCSGDPDSLDGVTIPKLKLGIVDGTAPHVIEPKCIGASSLYLDFSPFYNAAAMREQTESILAMVDDYQSYYRTAYSHLAALPCPLTPDALPADAQRRFDAAICCKGLVRLHNLDGATVVSREELQARLSEALVVYLHPLWHTVVEGVMTKDAKTYRTEIETPDCASAIQALAQAKERHDALEAAYRPYIDFAGVEGLAETLLKKLFK